jgi:predicted negative regulator of RcsB-dependent stress response
MTFIESTALWLVVGYVLGQITATVWRAWKDR